MTRADIIAMIAKRYPHLSATKIEEIVVKVFENFSEQLQNGGRVEMRNFGSFDIKERKSRIGRNPKTGESVQIESKNVPFFKAGKKFREKLNS